MFFISMFIFVFQNPLWNPRKFRRVATPSERFHPTTSFCGESSLTSMKSRLSWRSRERGNLQTRFSEPDGRTSDINCCFFASDFSYAGIGWRPQSASKACQKWPLIGDDEDNLARSIDIDNIKNVYPIAEGTAEGKKKTTLTSTLDFRCVFVIASNYF